MQGVRLVLERARRSPSWLIDSGLVLLVGVVRLIHYGVLETAHDPPVAGEFVPPLALLTAVPLALRRRFPFAVLAAAGVGEVALLLLDLHALPLAPLIALYTVAASRSHVESLVALVCMLVALVAVVVAVGGVPFVLATAVSLGMAWALGALQRARRRYVAELERRGELLERERETEAQLAVSEERSRIAHEIHDIVAHGVGVMIVQAAGARRSLRADPYRAERAMAEVERAGRQSLAEIRRLLGLLDRHTEAPELTPQPGLHRLGELLEQFSRIDLPVDLVVAGQQRELPQGVDLSAFRIVQEGLTNVLKHAGHVPVTVTLHYRERSLGVEIVNCGNGSVARPSSSPTGRGLIGMRERVALIGGSLSAGPQPNGGFRVACELPLNGA